MNIGFEGQTVVVTGAAHGFGRAIAHAFVNRGAHVFACDVNADGLAETQRICGAACGIEVHWVLPDGGEAFADMFVRQVFEGDAVG